VYSAGDRNAQTWYTITGDASHQPEHERRVEHDAEHVARVREHQLAPGRQVRQHRALEEADHVHLRHEREGDHHPTANAPSE
jgi:hypothetical protein